MTDVPQDARLMFINVRRLSHCQLDSEDAQRPDINLVGVIATTFDKFWRHPAHCANFGLTSLLLLSQYDSIAEVCKFDLAVGFD